MRMSPTNEAFLLVAPFPQRMLFECHALESRATSLRKISAYSTFPQVLHRVGCEWWGRETTQKRPQEALRALLCRFGLAPFLDDGLQIFDSFAYVINLRFYHLRRRACRMLRE